MIEVNGHSIEAVIIDMDGVLWRKNEPIVDLPALFQKFSDHSIKISFATNNAMNSAADYQKKLESFGVSVNDLQIVTSAMAAANLVSQDYPEGGPVFMRGSDALTSLLIDFGFYHSSEEPQAVIAGIHSDFGYESVKEISLLLQKGVPFYYTNPDPTYPTPEGNLPGAGTILAALETASGIQAKIAGKPLPYLFELAMSRMRVNPGGTLVIGDRLNTDILGGYNAGCKTLFVLSGVNSKEDLAQWNPKPDLVLDDISKLFTF